MKRFVWLYPVVLLGSGATFVWAVAPPPAKAPPPPAPLTITRDERTALLGFSARIELVRLRAERELTAIAAEQREYLGRVADRLGVPLERLGADYTINLDTLAVEPRPAKPPTAAKGATR